MLVIGMVDPHFSSKSTLLFLFYEYFMSLKLTQNEARNEYRGVGEGR